MAVLGESVRSEDIGMIGPREVMAKMNNSQSPSGFHSNGILINRIVSRLP